MVTSKFPSRDELQSLIQNLEEASKDYDDIVAANGTAARSKLITLAKDLISQLRDPMDMADAHIANANELVAIRTCLHLKVFQAIPYPGSASLDEISVQTSANSALLERLLRILVCTGFLLSPAPSRYAHTKHSYAYTLIPGPGMFFQLVYDESFLMIDNLHIYLSEKGYQEPIDQRYSPYAWKSKQEGTDIWEIMAQHPERLHAFQAGLAHADASIPLLGYYDFGQLGNDTAPADRTILVDVGGGAGHAISQVLQAYPQLDSSKFVLQDLPAVLKKASQNELLPKQVQLMQHDFFTEQPVKGAKAYFLRRTLHDYSDPVCTDILSKLVPAMAPDSRILIADLMFPEHVTSKELGIASFDITMFNMGGKERTEACFRRILNDAGCELVKVWRSDFGFGVIVEARLKGAAQTVAAGPVHGESQSIETTSSVETPGETPAENGDVSVHPDTQVRSEDSVSAQELSSDARHPGTEDQSVLGQDPPLASANSLKAQGDNLTASEPAALETEQGDDQSISTHESSQTMSSAPEGATNDQDEAEGTKSTVSKPNDQNDADGTKPAASKPPTTAAGDSQCAPDTVDASNATTTNGVNGADHQQDADAGSVEAEIQAADAKRAQMSMVEAVSEDPAVSASQS